MNKPLSKNVIYLNMYFGCSLSTSQKYVMEAKQIIKIDQWLKRQWVRLSQLPRSCALIMTIMIPSVKGTWRASMLPGFHCALWDF